MIQKTAGAQNSGCSRRHTRFRYVRKLSGYYAETPYGAARAETVAERRRGGSGATVSSIWIPAPGSPKNDWESSWGTAPIKSPSECRVRHGHASAGALRARRTVGQARKFCWVSQAVRDGFALYRRAATRAIGVDTAPPVLLERQNCRMRSTSPAISSEGSLFYDITGETLLDRAAAAPPPMQTPPLLSDPI